MNSKDLAMAVANGLSDRGSLHAKTQVVPSHFRFFRE
jgi:hypothetical protein